MMARWAYEPAERPDAGDLKDAIQKGLGRAHRWATTGLWTDKTVLLEACLNDLRYDRQCEESRGPWLWEIMEAVHAVDELREAILESLSITDDGFAGQQLCQFAVFYARKGDERFRLGLQEVVSRKPDQYYPAFGEEELIDLDGEAGFLFAACVHDKSPPPKEWEESDSVALVETAVAKLGEFAVASLLERESQTSNAMKRLRDSWRSSKERKARQGRELHADRMRNISLNTVIQAAEVEKHQTGFLRGWGMYAAEADLRLVLDRLLNTQDPAVLANYLRVFSNRSMPEFNEKLLCLLDHPDENVRARAHSALAQNSHPLVRNFAVNHLGERASMPFFLQLFIRNFEPGDEEMLLGVLLLPEDADERHGILMDLRKILEHNSGSKCQELATIIYRFTPCGSCRHDAAKLLMNRGSAPGWLIEECRHDAVEDTRRLAATPPIENSR